MKLQRKVEMQVNLKHHGLVHLLKACEEMDAPEVLLFSEYINALLKGYPLVPSKHTIKIYGVNELVNECQWYLSWPTLQSPWLVVTSWVGCQPHSLWTFISNSILSTCWSLKALENKKYIFTGKKRLRTADWRVNQDFKFYWVWWGSFQHTLARLIDNVADWTVQIDWQLHLPGSYCEWQFH